MQEYFKVAIYGPVLTDQAAFAAFDGSSAIHAGLLELGFLTGRIAELKRLMRGLNAEELYEAWTHHVHAVDTPFLIDDGLPAEARPSALFRRSADFDMRYVCDAAIRSVTLYHRDRRIDFRIEALPLVQGIVSGAPFTGSQTVGWLGCAWADAKPMLETLITSGVLVVDVRS